MKFARQFLSRFLLFSAIVVGALSCNRFNPRQLTHIPTYRAAEQRARAVEISVACDNGWKSGSGVIIDARRVITARHVVDCRDGKFGMLAVTDANDNINLMYVIGLAGEHDAALLALSPGADLWDAPAVSFGSVGVDQTVCLATGHPNRRRECGIVDAVIEDWLYTSAIVDYGNSGSGVYNTRDELVGVAVRLMTCSNGQICGSITTTDISGGWVLPEKAPANYR